MTGQATENNQLDKRLKSEDVQRVDEWLIDRVLEWSGQTPFRIDLEKPWRDYEHRPDLKQRRIFPSVGYREANGVAIDFEQAFGSLGRNPRLRLLTLRLDLPRPKPKELDAHVVALTDVYSRFCDNRRRANKRKGRNSPTPILSAVHLRMSDSETDRLDPHIHCIWEVDEDDLSPTLDKMRQEFGQVWIHPKPVDKPRQCAFYICAGVVDYTKIESWPEEAVKAVWYLSAEGEAADGENEGAESKIPRKYRLIRRAGWFLQKGDFYQMIDLDHSTPPEDAPEKPENDPGGLPRAVDGHSSTETPNDAQAGLNGEVRKTTIETSWKNQLFKMLPPVRPSRWARLTKQQSARYRRIKITFSITRPLVSCSQWLSSSLSVSRGMMHVHSLMFLPHISSMNDS